MKLKIIYFLINKNKKMDEKNEKIISNNTDDNLQLNLNENNDGIKIKKLNNKNEKIVIKSHTSLSILNNIKNVRWNDDSQYSFFYDPEDLDYYHKFNILPKGLGTLNTHQNQTILKGFPFIISYYETYYLYLK